MKKNKTIAYMLAATLLVGGTFVGTKALFTDQVSNAGELAISTGDVDIEITDGGEWELTRNGAELADRTNVNVPQGDLNGKIPDISGGEDDDFTKIGKNTKIANNLKPGDKLEKTVTVQNQGTLVANLNLSKNNNTDFQGLDGLFSLEETFVVDGNNNQDSIEGLKPGETVKVKLILEVKNLGGRHEEEASASNYNASDVENEKSYNSDTIENTVVNLTNAWLIDATQQNDLKLPAN